MLRCSYVLPTGGEGPAEEADRPQPAGGLLDEQHGAVDHEEGGGPGGGVHVRHLPVVGPPPVVDLSGDVDKSEAGLSQDRGADGDPHGRPQQRGLGLPGRVEDPEVVQVHQ